MISTASSAAPSPVPTSRPCAKPAAGTTRRDARSCCRAGSRSPATPEPEAMTWTNGVVWQEGMFLRAEHFQQQDRHGEQLVRASLAAAHPYPWGVRTMAIDRDLLA